MRFSKKDKKKKKNQKDTKKIEKRSEIVEIGGIVTENEEMIKRGVIKVMIGTEGMKFLPNLSYFSHLVGFRENIGRLIGSIQNIYFSHNQIE